MPIIISTIPTNLRQKAVKTAWKEEKKLIEAILPTTFGLDPQKTYIKT